MSIQVGLDGRVVAHDDFQRRILVPRHPVDRHHARRHLDAHPDRGGPQLEAVLANMNFKARIAVCGLIASYNA